MQGAVSVNIDGITTATVSWIRQKVENIFNDLSWVHNDHDEGKGTTPRK
jgi:hypothetical protein